MTALQLNIDFPDLQGARCTETDPEMFFSTSPRKWTSAKELCAGCPVRDKCLQWAVEHQVVDGIWGGLTARDRKPLLRQAKRCPDCRDRIPSHLQLCGPCREERRLARSRSGYTSERAA